MAHRCGFGHLASAQRLKNSRGRRGHALISVKSAAIGMPCSGILPSNVGNDGFRHLGARIERDEPDQSTWPTHPRLRRQPSELAVDQVLIGCCARVRCEHKFIVATGPSQRWAKAGPTRCTPLATRQSRVDLAQEPRPEPVDYRCVCVNTRFEEELSLSGFLLWTANSLSKGHELFNSEMRRNPYWAIGLAEGRSGASMIHGRPDGCFTVRDCLRALD
jgi:hypothetical protein